MAESSAERRRLLIQAAHGFAQHHPDFTMAGVDLEIARAVGLSASSVQRWRAGYPIPERHIPTLAEWAVRQAGMDRHWLRSFLHHCVFSDDGLEARLFGAPVGPSTLARHQACQAANARLWGSERLLSAAALHLPRAAPISLIESFLASDKSGLILIGASGLGKTSLALWLATGQTNLDRPIVVYPAALLDGERTLNMLLRDTLQPHLDPTSADDRPLLAWPMLVIFDGVNESLEMMRLTWQIDRALVDVQGLKVVMTFRPESFQIVRRNLTLSEHCYFTDTSSMPQMTGLALDPPAIQLLPFTPDELAQAYALYQRSYALKTPYASLPASVRQA